MLDVLICHAPQDRGIAETIGARLESCAEARPWLEEADSAENTLAEIWDRGLAGAAILLLLSPGAVRKRVQREQWAGLLEHVEGSEAPPVFCVKIADCAYPKLLERRRFLAWTGDGFETLREIERAIVGLHPPVAGRLDLAPVPGFAGRDFEIDALFATLTDEPGQAVLLNPDPGSGKTALAQEFARRASRHFREVFWAACGERHPEAIHNDLREQAGTAAFLEHRVLAVLDDVSSVDQLLVRPEKARASILMTSRLPGLRAGCREFHIDNATAPETRDMAPDSPAGRILAALRTCRPHGASVRLAARIAGIGEDEAPAAISTLITAGRVDPFDSAGSRVRLTRREAPDPDAEAAHAETAAEAIERWRVDGALAAAALPEADAAIEWGFRHHWRLSVRLSQCLFTYLRSRGRHDEARRVMERLAGAAEARGDEAALKDAEWEISWMAGGAPPSGHGPALAEQLPLDFGF